MKLATTAKLPKKTSTKVNDLDNPAWTEDCVWMYQPGFAVYITLGVAPTHCALLEKLENE